MRVAIIYSTFIIFIWLIGMLLDISGLYISVKYASENKVKLSKVGYKIMRFGEVFEYFAKEVIIFAPAFLFIKQ